MKCIAIDDEPLALKQLTVYISRVPFLSLVKPCQDAFEAMKVLADKRTDKIQSVQIGHINIHKNQINLLFGQYLHCLERILT